MYLYRLFVILFLSLGSSSFAATLDEKIDFLILQKDYYSLSQKINLKHMTHYTECLSDESTLFTFNYFKEDGEIATKELSCTEVLPTIFDNRLKIEYAKMRIFLALSKPGRRDEAYAMSMSDNVHYKINVNIDHPNDTSMTRLSFNIERPKPLSKGEIKRAMRVYNKYTAKMCKLYTQDILKKELEDQSLIKRLEAEEINHIQVNFCEGLDLRKYSSNTRYAFLDILRNYHRWLENRRFEFRKKYLNLYYEQINQSPYFLLIKTRHPTKDELLRALNIIKKNALEKEKKINQHTIENQIEQKIMDYQVKLMSEIEKTQLFEDLTFYVNDPLFFKFYQVFGNELTEEAKLEIDEVIAGRVLIDEIKEVSIIVGGLASCFLPSQKLFKLLKVIKPLRGAKIFRLSCFTALGVPLNSWFIYRSLERYEASIVELLSSVDGRQLIREYNSVSRSELIINSLFVATGVGAARSLVKAIKVPTLLNH